MHRKNVAPRSSWPSKGPAALLALSLSVGCRALAEAPPLGPDAPIWNTLDRELSTLYQKENLPGLSVAVLLGSEVVFAEGYGWANRERRVPVTVDTLFPIASIEKEFTAAAVMRLVEQGKLRLDDPLSAYLPELDTGGHTVTIRNMLQQVSGLQETETLEAWWSQTEAGAPPDGLLAAPRAARIQVGEGFAAGDDVARYQGAPLYHAPGERWTYSQPNYDLMCLVIADLSGGTYYDAIGELARSAEIPF